MEGLGGNYRSNTVVCYDDLCLASRIIYLHTVSGEACCDRSQSFSDFGEELVGGVRKDGDCEIVEEGRNGKLVGVFCRLLVECVLLAKGYTRP